MKYYLVSKGTFPVVLELLISPKPVMTRDAEAPMTWVQAATRSWGQPPPLRLSHR